MLRKLFGFALVAIGLVALLTPLTPGSWLIFIGLQILGFRFLLWDRMKSWLRRRP